jgi:23S rRNA pseudouridine1911/1915/1917 synthase
MPPAAPLAELDPRRLLHLDDAVVVVDKPAGLVVHATVDRQRDHLVAAVRRLLGRLGHGTAHLGLVHRLDRDTSGVVVLARTPASEAALGAAFARREVDKRYLAIVHDPNGVAAGADPRVIATFLAPGRGSGGRTVVVHAGGKPAQTELRWLASAGPWALMEARPRTGRTHQIRVHLAHVGLPIAGDPLYGEGPTSDRGEVKRLMLHAAALTLVHPSGQGEVTWTAPSPRGFVRRFPQLRAPG